ncbi:MAG TPA: GHMP kinase [Bacillota bacterium]|nr:GHMP kinase [Bacillota bacterium]
MEIRSRAPLRISFAGGGTDIEPYLSEKGGVVLSTTINRYSYGTMVTRSDQEIQVESLDVDLFARFLVTQKLDFNGQLDLVKAVLRKFEGWKQGFSLFLHSDAPPGSGLGSSSTLVVTILGLFRQWLNLPWSEYDIAQLAYEIERVDLGIRGGKQDQYAAVFGGFNFIEFYHDSTIVNPLRIKNSVLNELEYHLLLCYTGKTRLSANIIATQVEGYLKKKESSLQALDQLKAITIAMKNALLQGKLNLFGELLHESWIQKKQLAGAITNEKIDTLYHLAINKGALGGKILGAGGGGYLLLYCPYNRKHLIANELEKLGGQITPFNFENQGLATWKVQ